MANSEFANSVNKYPPAFGVTNDASFTPTALRMDPSTKRLLVDVGTISVSASSASDGVTGSAVPADASYIGANSAGNLVGLLLGQQTMANSLAVVLPSNQAAIPVSQSGSWVIGAGSNVIGAVTQSGSWVLSAGSAIIGKVTTDQTTHGTTDLVAADITKIGGTALALGQTTMSASIPVVLSSNQSAVPVSQSGSWILSAGSNLIGSVELSNGTNVADVIAPGTGQNSLLVAGAYKEVAYTTTTVQAVASMDVSNYKWISIHQTSNGTNSTSTFQGSNDNTNWVALNLVQINSGTSSSSSNTTSTNALFHGPIGFRYFRINVTGISAGTTAGTIELYTEPTIPLAFGATVSQTGTWTVQPGNTANTTAWLMDLHSIGGSALAIGQAAMASSIPVVIASNQTAMPVSQSGTWTMGSNSATGSAVPANAFYGGGIAKTALPSAATDGNLTGEMVDKFGRQVVVGGTVRDLKSSQRTTISASTSETTIVTAGATGVFNDIYLLLIENTSGTGTRIDFRDATSGTIIFDVWLPANDTRGFAIPGESIPQTTAANNWTAQCSVSVTDVRITAFFEKNK